MNEVRYVQNVDCELEKVFSKAREKTLFWCGMTGLCMFALKILTNSHMINQPVRWGQRSNEADISSFFILFLSSGPHASPLLPWHICSFFISSPTYFCFFFHKMLLSCLLSITPHICHFHYFIFYCTFFPFFPVLSEPLFGCVPLCVSSVNSLTVLCVPYSFSLFVYRGVGPVWPFLLHWHHLRRPQTYQPKLLWVLLCFLLDELFLIDTNSFVLCPLKTQE